MSKLKEITGDTETYMSGISTAIGLVEDEHARIQSELFDAQNDDGEAMVPNPLTLESTLNSVETHLYKAYTLLQKISIPAHDDSDEVNAEYHARLAAQGKTCSVCEAEGNDTKAVAENLTEVVERANGAHSEMNPIDVMTFDEKFPVFE